MLKKTFFSFLGKHQYIENKKCQVPYSVKPDMELKMIKKTISVNITIMALNKSFVHLKETM